jgi:hypothetical protein
VLNVTAYHKLVCFLEIQNYLFSFCQNLLIQALNDNGRNFADKR